MCSCMHMLKEPMHCVCTMHGVLVLSSLGGHPSLQQATGTLHLMRYRVTLIRNAAIDNCRHGGRIGSPCAEMSHPSRCLNGCWGLHLLCRDSVGAAASAAATPPGGALVPRCHAYAADATQHARDIRSRRAAMHAPLAPCKIHLRRAVHSQAPHRRRWHAGGPCG
jgi:hypothetical protein